MYSISMYKVLIGERSELPVGSQIETSYCRMFITRRMDGRFYGLDLKKEMIVLETFTVDSMENGRILRPNERNLDLHAACLVDSCQGKDVRVKLLNSSTR